MLLLLSSSLHGNLKSQILTRLREKATTDYFLTIGTARDERGTARDERGTVRDKRGTARDKRGIQKEKGLQGKIGMRKWDGEAR